METKDIHVLLIEDDSNAEVIKHLLTTDGSVPKNQPHFQFNFAKKMDHAFDCLKQGDIDVVVLDLEMTRYMTTETVAQLQGYYQQIPIVVISSFDDEQTMDEVVRSGAQDCLIREQLNQRILVRTLLNAIERHKIKHELHMMSTELRAINSQLEQLALSDPLTGLLNRRGLQEALFREMKWARRNRASLLVLILDLDDFKKVNDNLGHGVGDVILKEIAAKIRTTLRKTDYVARIGGDEFLILMPQTKPAEGIRVAEKLRLALSSASFSMLLKEDLRITASLGLVRVTEELVSVDDLIAKSHVTLSQSKKNGKNRISYTNEDTVIEREENPLTYILEALRHDSHYYVVKQPIFNLMTNDRMGYEFLSRMNIEGFEMPDDFFRVCLENNILTVVDYHCLKKCIQAGQLLPHNVKRHLNLFPSTMIDIPEEIVAIFPPAPKGTYCVEISEQQIIGDPSYLRTPVNLLKEAGICIAIDDVGFGRSCLESLIILEPDIVKVDKRWVNGIAKNNWCVRSLERLLKVAGALGTNVVAEGIESPDDLKVLKTLGITLGQGYLLGRPA